MKIALACLIGLCLPLTLEAGTAESIARGGSQPGVADTAAATEDTATDARARIGAGRANGQVPPPAASGNGAAERVPIGGRKASGVVAPRPTPVAPRRAIGAAARSNSDRLHSLRNKTAPVRLAKPSSRPVAARSTATGNEAAPARGSSTFPKGLAQPHVSKPVAVVRALPTARSRATMLGGPASGLGANAATINGSRAHRRF